MKVSPHLTGRLLGKAARAARRIDYALLYQRFSAYTMVKPPAFRHNLELARAFRGAPGLVVECGVWRGGMSAALATVLGPERSYYLFDSFEGLPPPVKSTERPRGPGVPEPIPNRFTTIAGRTRNRPRRRCAWPAPKTPL